MLLRRFILLTLFALGSVGVYAQTEWKAWTGANLSFSFSRKLDLRLSHLRSYDLETTVKNGFNQSAAILGYDLSRKLSISGGVMHTASPSSGSATQRYLARISAKFPIAGLTWTNSLQGEWHSPSETRFRERIIFISRINNRKRLDFLNLTLSATFWMYYNIGGNQLRYFDDQGTVIGRNTPDGFHRYRLFLNASSRISKNFSVSLYVMRQQEFNLTNSEFNKINVVHPVTGRVYRPFSNFNVAGINLAYDIQLYKKSNHKK